LLSALDAVCGAGQFKAKHKGLTDRPTGDGERTKRAGRERLAAGWRDRWERLSGSISVGRRLRPQGKPSSGEIVRQRADHERESVSCREAQPSGG
jgi:hypothetical protein